MIYKALILVVCIELILSYTVLADNIKQLGEFVNPIDKISDYNPLIKKAGLADIVLIGDSTHGTHEFYQQRINLTKRLIQEKQFKLIFIEADWPNTHILNQYIQSQISLSDLQKINPFKKYPVWMWKNQEMFSFLKWLRQYNQQLADDQQKVSLFGMDMYSYHPSMKWVIDYFLNFYPAKAAQIITNYQCLQIYNEPGEYGQTVAAHRQVSCEQQTKAVFEIFANCHIRCNSFASDYHQNAFFHARQQAFIVHTNEQYYRSMYTTKNDTESWNIRDSFMFHSIINTRNYFNNSKAVVWAHSSHLGDARATSVSAKNQHNVGQLLRQYFNTHLYSISMLSYKGEVIASDSWGAPVIKKIVNPANNKSYEYLFHQLNIANFFLLSQQLPPRLYAWLNNTRLQRHVGVIYFADNEIDYHYNEAQLMDEYDSIIFIDNSSALHWSEHF